MPGDTFTRGDSYYISFHKSSNTLVFLYEFVSRRWDLVLEERRSPVLGVVIINTRYPGECGVSRGRDRVVWLRIRK